MRATLDIGVLAITVPAMGFVGMQLEMAHLQCVYRFRPYVVFLTQVPLMLAIVAASRWALRPNAEPAQMITELQPKNESQA